MISGTLVGNASRKLLESKGVSLGQTISAVKAVEQTAAKEIW